MLAHSRYFDLTPRARQTRRDLPAIDGFGRQMISGSEVLDGIELELWFPRAAEERLLDLLSCGGTRLPDGTRRGVPQTFGALAATGLS